MEETKNVNQEKMYTSQEVQEIVQAQVNIAVNSALQQVHMIESKLNIMFHIIENTGYPQDMKEFAIKTLWEFINPKEIKHEESNTKA